jgi:two-component system KDP operon response regulator KdpE
MNPKRILVVDDDPSIRKFVRANLEARDYTVLLAADGEEALGVIEKDLPDLIILDIMMPYLDGFEVCRRVREWSQIPIIMLSARDDEDDKVKCLDAGADDYLTKPFSLRELLSRIKAVLRRSEQDAGKPKVQCGELEVDLLQNIITMNGQIIDLTPTEYQILSYLAVNAGKVITFQQLAEKISGDNYTGGDHLIQVNINRLRKKLGDTSKEAKYIQTKYGIGYVLLKTQDPR